MGGPAFNATVSGNGNPGVQGTSTSSFGVRGISSNGPGVEGTSTSSFGVRGTSTISAGVRGRSVSGAGMFGTCLSGPGVQGIGSTGVEGASTDGIGVFGQCFNPNFSLGHAGGFFFGGLIVEGGLDVRSDLSSRIDHPLDLPNKYLVHTSVESSERKNVYDGVVWLDKDGAVWVELPEWFEALNGDFRYQLTAIGGAAPNLHVAEEISENRFKIAGGEDGMKVCWQVTGSRKDPWAAANPFEVEQEKPEEVRGRYLYPSLYGAPEEQRIMRVPVAEAAVEEALRREMEELGMERREEPPAEST